MLILRLQSVLEQQPLSLVVSKVSSIVVMKSSSWIQHSVIHISNIDFYRPLIKCAEAIPKGVPIVPRSLNTQQSLKERLVDGKFTYDPQYDGWEVDYEILKNTLNDKTKILLLNSPLNPAGKYILL